MRPPLSGPAAPAPAMLPMDHGGPHPESVTSSAPMDQMAELVRQTEAGQTISLGPTDMDDMLAREREIATAAAQPFEPWRPEPANPWDSTQALQPQPTSVGFPVAGAPSAPAAPFPSAFGEPGAPGVATAPSQPAFASQPGFAVPGAPSFAPLGARPRQDVPPWAKVAMVFGIACLFVAVALVVRFLVIGAPAGPATSSSAAPATSPSSDARSQGGAATSAPKASPSSAPSSASKAGAGEGAPTSGAVSGDSAEHEAGRAALADLQKGIEKCVRESIGVIPGTAPPIPPSFHFIKKGGYQSSARDWSSPVYGCSAFSITGPQPFVLQWQLTKPNTEGVGIVFFDDDGDKRVDRSLSFTATLLKHKHVKLESIVEDDPPRQIVPTR